MSRNVDLTEPLNESDAIYVAQRPWMLRDAALAGIDVTYDGAESTESSQGTASSPEQGDSVGTGLGKGAEATESGATDSEEDEETYNDWTNQQLRDEISARNEQLDEDGQIVPDSPNKPGLVAALEGDDEAADE